MKKYCLDYSYLDWTRIMFLSGALFLSLYSFGKIVGFFIGVTG